MNQITKLSIRNQANPRKIFYFQKRMIVNPLTGGLEVDPSKLPKNPETQPQGKSNDLEQWSNTLNTCSPNLFYV